MALAAPEEWLAARRADPWGSWAGQHLDDIFGPGFVCSPLMDRGERARCCGSAGYVRALCSHPVPEIIAAAEAVLAEREGGSK